MSKNISRILILLAILFSKFEAQAQNSSHQGQVIILLPFFVNADTNETQKVVGMVTHLLSEDNFSAIANAKCSVKEFVIPPFHWSAELTVIYECETIDSHLPVEWSDANNLIAKFLKDQTGYTVIYYVSIGAIVIGGNENETVQ